MNQLLQHNNGILEIAAVPAPRPGPHDLLVRNAASVISVGTEKHMMEFARKNLLGKALARPDLVRQVVNKARSEGVLEAYRQTRGRLDLPTPLGYSSAGIVVDVGREVTNFSVGQRVACSGSNWAVHAEYVAVPATLCAGIPDAVSFDEAAFVALGGIALQAVRLAQVSIGSQVAVIGLGLLGQIAVQLLKAAGCHVYGFDLIPAKAAMALEHGAEAAASDFQYFSALCRESSGGTGVDAVLMFAASASNEPLEHAAAVAREHGRVVAAGLVGMEIPRRAFYEKELDLVVSRAWGPGLYDTRYTGQGADYPVPYARWTAGRNLAEFLAQVAKGNVHLEKIVSHRFPFERAIEAYRMIGEGKQAHLGVLLQYPSTNAVEMPPQRRITSIRPPRAAHRDLTVGFIGAGQFARGTLLPLLKSLSGVRYKTVATSSGLSARHMADELGFEGCSTDYKDVLTDPEIDLVLILTRHGSHAHLVAEALRAGKHVFVEKPLALNREQMDEVDAAYQAAANSGSWLMVGFNRRFAPATVWLHEQFREVAEPVGIHCTVNAGLVAGDSWVHDREQGGGRVMGELCHFIDLAQFLSGSLPVRVSVESIASPGYLPSDNVIVNLKMANGSIASLTYLAGGDKLYPRERVEVIGGGAVGVIDNFRAATVTRGGRTKKFGGRWTGVDRGYTAELKSLIEGVRQGQAPVAFDEYRATTLATFAIEEALRTGNAVTIAEQNDPAEEEIECVFS